MLKNAHLAGIGFSLIFGFSYMLSKVALEHISPMGLIAYRYLMAFFAIEMLRLLKIIPINLKNRNYKTIALIVLFQPILYSIFSIYGINLIASSEAIMMIALIPVFSGILGGIVLKEAPSIRQILFILISFGGVVYIQTSLQTVDSPSQPLGFLLVLLSVMCGAIYNVSSKSASKTMRSIDITYYMMFFGALTFNILYFTTLVHQGTPLDYLINLGNLELLAPVLYLGILSSVAAFFLLNYALSKLPAHVVGIYANLVTVIGIFAGFFILNENLYYFHFIGSGLIIIGVYGTVSSKKPKMLIKEDI